MEDTSKAVPSKNPGKYMPWYRAVSSSAILIAILTGFLYLCGWMYWNSFFSYFGIDLWTLGDLSFHQLVLGTFQFPIGVLVCMIATMALRRYFAKGVTQPGIDKVWLILNIILLLLFVMAYYFRLFFVLVLILSLAGLSVALLNMKFFSLNGFFNSPDWKQPFVLFLTVFFLFSVILCCIAGRRNAIDVFASTRLHTRITLEVESDSPPPEKTILIAHMKGKYFICEPRDNPDDQPQVIVIDDSRVIKAEINKPASSVN